MSNEDYRQGYRDGWRDAQNAASETYPSTSPSFPMYPSYPDLPPTNPPPYNLPPFSVKPYECRVCGMVWEPNKAYLYCCTRVDCPTAVTSMNISNNNKEGL